MRKPRVDPLVGAQMADVAKDFIAFVDQELVRNEGEPTDLLYCQVMSGLTDYSRRFSRLLEVAGYGRQSANYWGSSD